MLSCDEDDDILFESRGRLRKRSDDSPSPVREADQRWNPSEIRNRVSSNDAESQSLQSISRGWGRALYDDSTAAGSSSSSSRSHVELMTPTASASSQLSFIPDYFERNPIDQPEHVARLFPVETGQGFRVKEPSDGEDLTKEEFKIYQDRHGPLHKTSANQILQGTSDEEAENPTLGNRRCQARLDEDGTVARKDFDTNGGFEYSPPPDPRKGKVRERRRKLIQDLQTEEVLVENNRLRQSGPV